MSWENVTNNTSSWEAPQPVLAPDWTAGGSGGGAAWPHDELLSTTSYSEPVAQDTSQSNQNHDDRGCFNCGEQGYEHQ